MATEKLMIWPPGPGSLMIWCRATDDYALSPRGQLSTPSSSPNPAGPPPVA